MFFFFKILFLFFLFLFISFYLFFSQIFLRKFKFLNFNFKINKEDLFIFLSILNCLNDSGFSNQILNLQPQPFEKRKKHYLHLLNLLQKWHYLGSHCWKNYCGPWIEELWRDHFINESYQNFGHFIPIFVQWVNILKRVKINLKLFKTIVTSIFKQLDDKFLYITVSQSPFGLDCRDDPKKIIPPNILILSPSSHGHIPIPHLHKPRNFENISYPVRKFVFLGSTYKKSIRTTMIKWFIKNYPKNFLYGNSKNWIDEYKKSEIILSPRGIGRGCFRTYEALQMGMIPCIINDHKSWIPYQNSNVPWEEIAIIIRVDELNRNFFESFTKEKLKKMRENIRKFTKSHFSYSGLLHQIELLMKGGFQKSDLRCDKYTR